MTLPPHTSLCSYLSSCGYNSPTSGPTKALLPSGHKTGMKRTKNLLCAQGTRCPRGNCALPPSSTPPEWDSPALGKVRLGSSSRGARVGGRKDSQEAKHGQRGSNRIRAHTGRAHERPTPPFSPLLWFCSQLDPCQPPTPPLPSLLPTSPCSSPVTQLKAPKSPQCHRLLLTLWVIQANPLLQLQEMNTL